ncbi:MAG: hypothetical protein ACLGGX_05875 [Bdellovibrionia bacterium]
MKYSQVWGIDQTGAKISSNKAKSLPAAFLTRKSSGIELEINLELDKLNSQSLASVGWNQEKASLIFVDTVLGLPNEIKKRFDRKRLQEAAQYQLDNQKYGAQVAYSFFRQYLTPSQQKDIPTRTCEVLAQANSIFKLTPYQRNIGCGSYRIWSDLGSDPLWFSFWPYETQKLHIIAEAYPSLLWKYFFKSPRFNEKLLRTLCKEHQITVSAKNFKSPDHMDAALMAVAGWLKQSQLQEPLPTIAKKEGWIFLLDEQ